MVLPIGPRPEQIPKTQPLSQLLVWSLLTCEFNDNDLYACDFDDGELDTCDFEDPFDLHVHSFYNNKLYPCEFYDDNLYACDAPVGPTGPIAGAGAGASWCQCQWHYWCCWPNSKCRPHRHSVECNNEHHLHHGHHSCIAVFEEGFALCFDKSFMAAMGIETKAGEFHHHHYHHPHHHHPHHHHHHPKDKSKLAIDIEANVTVGGAAPKDPSNLTTQANTSASAPKAKSDMYGSNWRHNLASMLSLDDGYFEWVSDYAGLCPYSLTRITGSVPTMMTLSNECDSDELGTDNVVAIM